MATSRYPSSAEERAERLRAIARVLRKEARQFRSRAEFLERHAHLLDRRARESAGDRSAPPPEQSSPTS